jgi:hypothetical protein
MQIEEELLTYKEAIIWSTSKGEVAHENGQRHRQLSCHG